MSGSKIDQLPGSQPVASLDIGEEGMAERIRTLDWASTPLGPSHQWQQSLRTVVNILLSSRYAMWMAWGPELTMLYNDAYRPTLGIKHPWALGKSASEVWSEIWPDIGPRIETVLTTGKATYDEGLLLFLERSGFTEETYHTFSYSPLTDDERRVSGMLCVVTEETERLIGERRVATLREVAASLARSNTEEELVHSLNEQLSRNKKDLPFTLTYLLDRDGTARLACSSGISGSPRLAPLRIEANTDSPWPLDQVFHHSASHVVDIPSSVAIHHDDHRMRELESPRIGRWEKPSEKAVIVPLKQQGQEQPAGFFVVGTNPYRCYDASYSGFIDLLAGQIAAGLANARAYETERRRAEALAEIDRSKTIFFSNVSHELRTPLTLMLSPLEELLSGVAEQSTQRELLELAHRNGLRLQKLVNTLLDFSRIEAGRIQADYEPIDLSRFTADLASNFRSAMERAGLTFTIECETLPEPVYVDREMWEKVVLNLLSNALKFTLRGSVTLTLRARGQNAVLTVQDTGTGIPESELPRIFERFHRVAGAKGRSIEGTGIGLALVQELVKLHAGSITVASEVSKGTNLTVAIPFGQDHLPKEKRRTGGQEAAPAAQSDFVHSDAFLRDALEWLGATKDNHNGEDGRPFGPLGSGRHGGVGGERILLAEDNADMRGYIARLLSERYDVVTVSNGEEALAAALKNPPGLILSDIMMPILDGFGLLKKLRTQPETRTVPVVLLSARAGEESRVEGLGAGADDYLVKPFTARELLARVAAHLSTRRRREEAEQALRESEATLQRSNEELLRANAELEQFAYSASHDLQEPLRQIAIYSQLLEKKYAARLDGKASQYLDYCVEGAHRMELLIRDLLAYSQAGRPSDSPAQLVRIADVLETVQKNLSSTIEETHAEVSMSELPAVRGDSVPLVHLFQNLLSNALKYRSRKTPRIRIAAKEDGDCWLFSIEDNGIGIPRDFQSQVFGLFKRLHGRAQYPGTGIGLAICQKIVEKYGGRIWVESEPDKGSEFFFTLPRGANGS